MQWIQWQHKYVCMQKADHSFELFTINTNTETSQSSTPEFLSAWTYAQIFNNQQNNVDGKSDSETNSVEKTFPKYDDVNHFKFAIIAH